MFPISFIIAAAITSFIALNTDQEKNQQKQESPAQEIKALFDNNETLRIAGIQRLISEFHGPALIHSNSSDRKEVVPMNIVATSRPSCHVPLDIDAPPFVIPAHVLLIHPCGQTKDKCVALKTILGLD